MWNSWNSSAYSAWNLQRPCSPKRPGHRAPLHSEPKSWEAEDQDSWSSGSHDLGSEYPAEPRASKKLCQPDNVRVTKFRRCMSPCTPHTCQHIDHHHQNLRSTDHWPTKWSYSGEDLTVGAKRNLIFLFAPTVRSSPTGRLIAKYLNLESMRAMLWKTLEGS